MRSLFLAPVLSTLILAGCSSGDLAYWYGHNRNFAGISVTAAQQIIGAPGFGDDAQSLRPFSGLQEGFVKLS